MDPGLESSWSVYLLRSLKWAPLVSSSRVVGGPEPGTARRPEVELILLVLGAGLEDFWKRRGTGKEWHMLRINPEEDPPRHISRADYPVAGFLHQRVRSFMRGLRAQSVKHFLRQV